MVSVSTPSAVLRIETKNQLMGPAKAIADVIPSFLPRPVLVARPPGQAYAPAVKFSLGSAKSPAGVSFRATLQAAKDDAESAGVLSLQLRNISRDIVSRFAERAYVHLTAGYDDGTATAPRTIFYGNLDYALPHREGSEVVWTVQATSNPAALLNTYVPVSAQSITMGEALTQLLAPLGMRPNFVDEVFFGRVNGKLSPALLQAVTYPQYTATRGVWQEINERIIPDMNRITGLVTTVLNLLPWHKKNPPFYGAIPSNTDPFQVDIVDLNATFGVELLQLNLDSPLVYSSGLSRITGGAEAPVLVEDSDQAETVEENLKSTEITVTRAFDPRIHLGLHVSYKGEFEGVGRFIVENFQHNIGTGDRWTTQFGGKVLGGDLFGK